MNADTTVPKPGRGGKRPGAGRKPSLGAVTVSLLIKLDRKQLDAIDAGAVAAGHGKLGRSKFLRQAISEASLEVVRGELAEIAPAPMSDDDRTAVELSLRPSLRDEVKAMADKLSGGNVSDLIRALGLRLAAREVRNAGRRERRRSSTTP